MNRLPLEFPEAYEQGREAGRQYCSGAAHIDTFENPYPPQPFYAHGYTEWHAWSVGWNDELVRDIQK